MRAMSIRHTIAKTIKATLQITALVRIMGVALVAEPHKASGGQAIPLRPHKRKANGINRNRNNNHNLIFLTASPALGSLLLPADRIMRLVPPKIVIKAQ